ncbi:MAG: carbamoyltransferase HypF [Dehalococcoidales bacterium]|nr:carbamoyltransferase HypF [Dehalococcoidales bacterium]
MLRRTGTSLSPPTSPPAPIASPRFSTPADRRYLYPFTNCTNCGPRFTIIADIPYDRANTTMKVFRMCHRWQQEYDDPRSRRFHAQPNACPDCGPRLELTDVHGRKTADDAIGRAAELLREGKIIAIKGLGGFLLACDAANREAVAELRRRKHRPAKPFAVMVATLEEARCHAEISDAEAGLLTSPAAPIVLVNWKEGSTITREVAPGLKHLGIMLPYTPLHHILLRRVGCPLVMTSGNLSEEPIARDNAEALSRLGGIADYFLLHNRDIYSRYDDSVMLMEAGHPRFVRRARGFAPHPVRLPFGCGQLLACGAGEKNTFCLARDNFAFVSQHIGDMDNSLTLQHFTETIVLYERLFRIKPEAIACDLHPDYLTTRYAEERAKMDCLPLVRVQHHHAHIASCLADNAVTGPVIGVAFDGTGYGSDGKIWGGEVLLADCRSFRRLAHLEYLPLPGGEAAIRNPYRTALGYLTALGMDIPEGLPALALAGKAGLDIIRTQVARGINSPPTSSMGRLFDAVSAIIGVRGTIEYEAQAAIELEVAASEAPDEKGGYPFRVEEQNGILIVRLGETLSAVIRDWREKRAQSTIAARFHNTVAAMVVELCQAISARTGLRAVALSGGVFQNRILLRKTNTLLESGGFTVYTHHQVPPNDGGVSLGQAAIAGSGGVDHSTR